MNQEVCQYGNGVCMQVATINCCTRTTEYLLCDECYNIQFAGKDQEVKGYTHNENGFFYNMSSEEYEPITPDMINYDNRDNQDSADYLGDDELWRIDQSLEPCETMGNYDKQWFTPQGESWAYRHFEGYYSELSDYEK